jgi:Zn-dependent alcohol dehydrogenase
VPEAARIEFADGQVATSSNVFTWADHTLADERYVVKVPSTIEPLVTSIIGCAVMTGAGAVENTANVQAGDSVAIFGVGGVGLSAVVAARARGANPLIAIDLDDEKLAFAKQFGATHVINAAKEDPIAVIRALTTQTDRHTIRRETVAGADFVFDCIGIRKTMEQIVPAARTGFFGAEPGGTAVLVGVPTTPVELDPIDLLMNEKRFIGSIGGSCSPDHDFPRYIKWYEEGTLDLNAMVTARYALDDINEATRALAAGEIQGRAILVF